MVIEAKGIGKGITTDNIGQAKSYARELLPACYAITNGERTMVFQFNGLLYQDKCVLDFERSKLNDLWEDVYKYFSKQAVTDRKLWLEELLKGYPQFQVSAGLPKGDSL